ncbi:flagellar protein FlaG [Lysinibacillus contaminans]|uniref:Flagellar protein FlaG n=1 Tax=Lysinibacillus contaminans TaxID=1293441 RepID=A0ABR5JX11_9BACI|nr:flagellar protein FlaG [Lysinibacillus contaminans]KOS66683.1 flagellar protein FlaG [Lysinibacillus contaminans]
MRISGNVDMDSVRGSKPVSNNVPTAEKAVKQGSETAKEQKVDPTVTMQIKPTDNSEETKAKVQEAVKKMNEMLEVNHSASKFIYHEGLERYYVTVVNKDTDEVVKEIPPKKLLDAFYEMQKMLGMVVDEKI